MAWILTESLTDGLVFFFFQDYISNHSAHIAKLALKKGKELLCCINIPPELLAVKDMRKTKEIKGEMPLKVTNVLHIGDCRLSITNLNLHLNMGILGTIMKTQTFSVTLVHHKPFRWHSFKKKAVLKKCCNLGRLPIVLKSCCSASLLVLRWTQILMKPFKFFPPTHS